MHVPKPGAAKGVAQKEAPAAEAQAPTDAQLVRRAQRGEVAAYEQLVRRHQRRVFAIVGGILRAREDMEDVAQQVFLKVYLALARFDLRSSFTTWLYKVTVNECWDYLRKKRARRLVYEADLSDEQAEQLQGRQGVGEPAEGFAAERRAERRDLLDRLLQALPKEEQLMLFLKEVEGFSVEEIGEIVGLNVNTVKVRLFRARGRLVELYRRRLAARPDRAAPKG